MTNPLVPQTVEKATIEKVEDKGDDSLLQIDMDAMFVKKKKKKGGKKNRDGSKL